MVSIEVTCSGLEDKPGTKKITLVNPRNNSTFTFEGNNAVQYEAIICKDPTDVFLSYLDNQIRYLLLPDDTIKSFLLRHNDQIYLASEIDHNKIMGTREYDNNSRSVSIKVDVVEKYLQSFEGEQCDYTKEFYQQLSELLSEKVPKLAKGVDVALENIEAFFNDPKAALPYLTKISAGIEACVKDIKSRDRKRAKQGVAIEEDTKSRDREIRIKRLIKANEELRTENKASAIAPTKPENAVSVAVKSKKNKHVTFDKIVTVRTFEKDDPTISSIKETISRDLEWIRNKQIRAAQQKLDLFTSVIIPTKLPDSIEVTPLKSTEPLVSLSSTVDLSCLNIYKGSIVREAKKYSKLYKAANGPRNTPLHHKYQAFKDLEKFINDLPREANYDNLIEKIGRNQPLSEDEVAMLKSKEEDFQKRLADKIREVADKYPLLFDGTNHFIRENFGIQYYTNTEKVLLKLYKHQAPPPIFSEALRKKIFYEEIRLGNKEWKFNLLSFSKQTVTRDDKRELLNMLRSIAIHNATLSVEDTGDGRTKILTFQAAKNSQLGITNEKFIELQKKVLGEKSIFAHSTAKLILLEIMRTLPRSNEVKIPPTSSKNDSNSSPRSVGT